MMPSLALSQPDRRSSYAAAVWYYGAALWPLIPAAKNFFGSDVSAVCAFAFWILSAALLSVPWYIVWSSKRIHAFFLAPLALLLTVVPPLGIIGWASPLTVAGVLFPGAAWLGLVFCAVVAGYLAIRPVAAAALLALTSVLCNFALFSEPRPVVGWKAVNTTFGRISHGSSSPVLAYQAAEWIQNEALASPAKVIVFPEAVVPTWTAATDEFWQQTLDQLRSSGKTILIGARRPVALPASSSLSYDFSADLQALGWLPREVTRSFRLSPKRLTQPVFGYENGLILRGAEAEFFEQRIPVPVAMWNPVRPSPRLNVFSRGVIDVHGNRAAILICYEQLLTWPVLVSMTAHPTVLIAVANDYWASGTPIPRFQLAATRGWARLFCVPYLFAVNR